MWADIVKGRETELKQLKKEMGIEDEEPEKEKITTDDCDCKAEHGCKGEKKKKKKKGSKMNKKLPKTKFTRECRCGLHHNHDIVEGSQTPKAHKVLRRPHKRASEKIVINCDNKP